MWLLMVWLMLLVVVMWWLVGHGSGGIRVALGLRVLGRVGH